MDGDVMPRPLCEFIPDDARVGVTGEIFTSSENCLPSYVLTLYACICKNSMHEEEYDTGGEYGVGRGSPPRLRAIHFWRAPPKREDRGY